MPAAGQVVVKQFTESDGDTPDTSDRSPVYAGLRVSLVGRVVPQLPTTTDTINGGVTKV